MGETFFIESAKAMPYIEGIRSRIAHMTRGINPLYSKVTKFQLEAVYQGRSDTLTLTSRRNHDIVKFGDDCSCGSGDCIADHATGYCNFRFIYKPDETKLGMR